MCDHVVEILKLMLVYFDDPEPAAVELIGNGLDTGGFACARIAEQKTVVRLPAADKGFRIVQKLPLLQLVSHQIRKFDMGDI